MWPRCGASCTKTFENEGLRIVTRGMQELIAQRNRKKNIKTFNYASRDAYQPHYKSKADPKTHPRTWCIIHSATVSPPIALCMSLMVESSPLPLGLVPGLAPPVTWLPLMTRGPSAGCLTPNAAPNILFPGSPIFGGPSACRIAGSSCDTAEFMRSFRDG